ncbi:rhodanese-like domain-containing protein [Flavobacterium cerinum]|uniref:Rhodanese-like domain-containing protein n=1 Tax=Flavobacterium cerinum TaxID=2502784 RepID=A0ABY5ISB4_9FLAO|nr:rhodanese-like domain-containing protein [Flavobacterium cerinum]UUC45685.1 rhodanese-like domain-containing protein [Flavobacterium cerinum]
MGLLDLLGLGNKNEVIKEFIAKGAIIIDVRTPEEFAGGHIKNAKNIPLQRIASEIAVIQKWNKPIITCCRSGMRSAQAATLLKEKNIEVINGGGWNSLENKI